MRLKTIYNPLKDKGKAVTTDSKKYLARFFGEIPDLAVTMEKPPPEEGLRPDFQVELRRGDQTAILLVEAKAVAEPRIVADWMARLRNARATLLARASVSEKPAT